MTDNKKNRGDRGVRYDALVLLSGGPDSTTLLHYAKQKHKSVLAFHFHTGLAPNKYELNAAKLIAKRSEIPLQIVDLGHYIQVCGGAMPTIHSEAHVLEFGTAVILTMTSAFALKNKIPKVYVALHKEDADEATEYSPRFIKYINDGIKLIEGDCEIIAPFHSWTKSQVITEGQKNKAPLELSWSCVSPIKSIQCGTCGACRARRDGFEKAKIKDMTKYSFK